MRSVSRLRLVPIGGLLFFFLGCGGSPDYGTHCDGGGCVDVVNCGNGGECDFVATPSATAAVNDGQTPTVLTITIKSSGELVPDGTSVSLAIDPNTNASFTAIQPGSSYSRAQTASPNSADGKVSVQMYDMSVEDVIVTLTSTVQAQTAGVPNTQLAGSTRIHFGGTCQDSFVTPATPTTATGNGESGVATYISLKCNDSTMGGSFPWETQHPFEGNSQLCTAFVGDGPNQGLMNAAVQYLTEAGAMQTSVQKPGQHSTMLTDSTGEASVEFHVSTPYPQDVPYDATLDGTLLSQSGSSTYQTPVQRWWKDGSGHVYNPRDGWVTLIAATAGKLDNWQTACAAGAVTGDQPPCSEPYVDMNDNGKWDDAYTDENGVHHPPEPFIDVNCNGKFDHFQTPDTNGYVRLWTSTQVLWTSYLYPQLGDKDFSAACGGVQGGIPPGQPNSPPAGDCLVTGEVVSLESPQNCIMKIPMGGICNFVFRVTDKNLNVPAMLGSGNSISGTPSNEGSCALAVSGIGATDLLYSEHLLVSPDFPFSVSNSASVTAGGASKMNADEIDVSVTANLVDKSDSNNGKLNEYSPVTWTAAIHGSCVGPQ